MFSANAFSSVYEVHDQSQSTNQSIDFHSSQSQHADETQRDCAGDHCVSHCSMWHILNLSASDSINLTIQAEEQKLLWFFISVSENNYSNKLWRPPTLVS